MKTQWKNPLKLTKAEIEAFPLWAVSSGMRQCDPNRFTLYSSYFMPMMQMLDAKQTYGCDSGTSVCRYALCNWTGSRSKVQVPMVEKLRPGVASRVTLGELLRAHVYYAEGGV